MIAVFKSQLFNHAHGGSLLLPCFNFPVCLVSQTFRLRIEVRLRGENVNGYQPLVATDISASNTMPKCQRQLSTRAGDETVNSKDTAGTTEEN